MRRSQLNNSVVTGNVTALEFGELDAGGAEVGIKRLRVGNMTKAAMVESNIKRYNRAVVPASRGTPFCEGIRNVIEYEVKLPLKIEREVSQESLWNLK